MAIGLDSVKDFFFGKPENSYEDDYEDNEYFDDDSFSEEETQSFNDRYRNVRAERNRKSYIREEENDGYGYDEPAKKGSPARIVLVRGQRFADVKRVADNLRQGRSIVLNVEDMEKLEAQRMLDFLGGTTFAYGGEVQKISHCTYIFAIGSVDLIGRIEELKETDSYFNF